MKHLLIMNPHYLIFSLTQLAFLPNFSQASRVLELSDKFLELSQEGQWLVKFYAPWCAHCRRLEPIWNHVAQALYSTPVRVAKLDCTRFSSVAQHFNVRAFPTIMFVKGDLHHEYLGEREKNDFVEYAMRMSGPPVQAVTKYHTIDYLKDSFPIFFGYVGNQVGPLWEAYVNVAERYQPHGYFYAMYPELMNRHVTLPNESSVFVYKDDKFQIYPGTTIEIVSNYEELNKTLSIWVNAERFGTFPKISRANFYDLLGTRKYLVLVVVEENRLNEITPAESEFKNMVETIIRRKKVVYHDRFQFGWIGSPDLANSIAMMHLPVPHLIVINSTTSHHHMPEDDPLKLTPEAIEVFLDEIDSQNAPVYGGNTFLVRLYRTYFEARSSLMDMWRGNPILTTLVFGLPLGFLSLIFYSICCADILDAEEEEEDAQDTDHEKKD